MRHALYILIPALICTSSAFASDNQIESITFEGAPVLTKHIQSGDPDFRDTHTLGIAKVHTQDYGNWGLYVLTPNSVDRTSIGFGYVTEDYPVDVGPMTIEFSGGLGLVTGYQDYPVPMLAGEAKLVLYQDESWDAGLSVGALPYFAEDRDGDNNFGVVVTSPFLSVKYKFQ